MAINPVIIPHLPKSWKAETAEKFNCSLAKVDKVARGLQTDADVLAHLISIAEANKMKERELRERLSQLSA